jgi:hypothetical protein
MLRFLLLGFLSVFAVYSQDFFLGVAEEKYLIGDYSGAKHLSKYINPNETQIHLLRPDTLEAFKEMTDAFEKYKADNKVKAPSIVARSAFRSYYDQKGIWDGKYTGKRKMAGYKDSLSSLEKVKLILKYSSAPGTSRHHWGTDIDINVLDNQYFEKGGAGELLYKWLQENAKFYGFCQPYNPLNERNNKGYYLENWHWSFAPVSQKLVRKWKENYSKKKKAILGKIEGIDSITEEMPLEYVTSVNSQCDVVEKEYESKKNGNHSLNQKPESNASMGLLAKLKSFLIDLHLEFLYF